MEFVIKDLEEDSQLEKYVCVPMKMTFENKMSWSMLASLLDGMTPSLKDCKQLIKILLKELQIVYDQKKVENKPQTIGKEETVNVVEENYVCDIQKNRRVNNEHENKEIQNDMLTKNSDTNKVAENETIANDDTETVQESSEGEMLDNLKEDSEQELQHAETYNLKDFYTFVGDNENYEKAMTDESLDSSNDGQTKMILKRGNSVQLECSICSKTFCTKQKLKLHSKTHSDEGFFRCKYCEQSFKQINDLKEHLKIHTSKRPFECKHCNKTFAHSTHLKVHERLHTKEKPFNCKHCGKCFTQSNHLKFHERTHTGEKPYECKYCKRCFPVHTALKIHERIHTGEVPFQCTECGKRFNCSSNLTHHRKTHKNERAYECKKCDKTFKTASNLCQHKRTPTHKAKNSSCSSD